MTTDSRPAARASDVIYLLHLLARVLLALVFIVPGLLLEGDVHVFMPGVALLLCDPQVTRRPASVERNIRHVIKACDQIMTFLVVCFAGCDREGRRALAHLALGT